MAKEILDQWRQLGYQVEAVVSDRPRTRCYKLARQGKFYFAKINLTDQAAVIANDIWWMQILPGLADPDTAPIRALRLVDHGDTWFITEWIEAPLLLGDSWKMGESEASSVVIPIVHVLQWLDRLSDRVRIGGHPGHANDPTESAPVRDLWRKVDGWLEAPLAAGRVAPVQVAEARRLIEEYQPRLQSALQHGDFVPWHMFRLSDDQFCLFDAEHASLVKPRYYDLAYVYTRFFTRVDAPRAARRILMAFVDQHENSDQFFEAFLPVVTLRALGMQADAYTDRERFDYGPAARELLDRCLRQDLQALLAE